MSLVLEDVRGAGVDPVHLRLHEGEWRVLSQPDPDAFVALVAGTAPSRGEIRVGRAEVGERAAWERGRCGLAVVSGRVPDAAPLRVVDLLLLAWPAPQPGWRALLGTAKARAAGADAEAQVRNLAGRLGLGAWLDADAVGLPGAVAALADLIRALVPHPAAVVWRRPEWLDADSAAGVREALVAEHQRLRFTVLEVTSSSSHLQGEDGWKRGAGEP